ncbi:MAG: hypothetical protein ACKOZT_08150 [Cyanobium sp.]
MGRNCLATLQERDSLGVGYNGSASLLKDRSGHFDLQSDPSDVRLGCMELAHAGARRFPAP